MTFRELEGLYYQPLFDLLSQSRAVHLQHWRGEEVQRCSLLSIKTSGCSEDCAYCAQSAHYSTGVERLLELLLTITTSTSELQFSSFENSGFFRLSSFALRHYFCERLTLKNLGSTSATHFAMKVPGASGLNKNLNRDTL